MNGFYLFAAVLIVVLYLLRKPIASVVYWCFVAPDEEVRAHRDRIQQLTRIKRRTDALFEQKINEVLNGNIGSETEDRPASVSTDDKDALPASKHEITIWHN